MHLAASQELLLKIDLQLNFHGWSISVLISGLMGNGPFQKPKIGFSFFLSKSSSLQSSDAVLVLEESDDPPVGVACGAWVFGPPVQPTAEGQHKQIPVLNQIPHCLQLL